MAVIESRVTEDGDVLNIKTDVPIVGVVALTSFIDDTTGETGSVYFEKTFRYSTNGGLTYSAWIALTTVNVQNIVVERVDFFVVEYKYKRIGTEVADLSFHSINLGGTVNPLPYPVYHSMFFPDFFGPVDTEMLDWALNVLEKLYKKGIVPNYMVRNNEVKDDKDYIAYWFSITHFFAILVYYARGFENIPASLIMMREFVKGREVYMKNNPDLDELYYIYSNYITEIQKRGTKQICERTLETFDISEGVVYYGGAIGLELLDSPVDGELIRLLNTIVSDDFLFAYTLRGDLGWCIGQSSPLYTGADNIINLIKGYEYSAEVLNIEKYPLLNPGFIFVSDYKMQIMSIPAYENAGIGVTSFSNAFALIVDPGISYEISYRIRRTVTDANLSFGVMLFDEFGQVVTSYRISDPGYDDNRFFSAKGLNQPNVDYWIRGVIHASDAAAIPGDVLTIGFGQNLQFPASAKYMIPIIIIENTTGDVLEDITTIWDIKIRPVDLWFSRGTLSARNFIIGYLKNNSAEYNNTQVEKIISEKLVPYNTYPLLKFI